MTLLTRTNVQKRQAAHYLPYAMLGCGCKNRICHFTLTYRTETDTAVPPHTSQPQARSVFSYPGPGVCYINLYICTYLSVDSKYI